MKKNSENNPQDQVIKIEENNDDTHLNLFLHKLGVDINSETDPELLIKILKDDMQLYEMIEIKELFGNSLIEKISLKSFLENVLNGIKEKHPAIIEFISHLIKNNIIENITHDSKEIIRKIIHHTYLLEEITKKMKNDLDFTETIYNHVLHKRKKIYIFDNYLGAVFGIYKYTGSIFLSLKTMSVDRAIKSIVSYRKNKPVNKYQTLKSRLLLVLNILEATIKDLFSGCNNNSICGLLLALKPIIKISVEGKNRCYKLHLNQDWCSLYETWNFTFCTMNLNNLHIIYPKLLIPSVINAEPSNYMHCRVLSLWLTINFLLLLKSNKYEMKNKREIAKIWGDINIKYGKKFLRENELNSFIKVLSSFFK